ncbi:MAG: polyprenyl diphosphate synthase [candidate division WOR-3 bacterium]
MNRKIPLHIAIVMDGNGRWAKEKGLPRLQGHLAGVNTVRRVIQYCFEFNVKYLTLFAFSRENWERPKEEVEGLMKLFSKVIKEEVKELKKNRIRVRFIGNIQELPIEIKESTMWIQEQTKNSDRLDLIIAFNYSGRSEIVEAVNKAVERGEKVTEESFRNFLFLPDVPDPDLFIRTSGELRISNFLLYQIAYSELFFTETLWPDFSKEDFIRAIRSYQKRERRFGAIREN